MSSNAASTGIAVHPAPQRAHVGPWLLGFVIGGAPAAWAIQILINYGWASYVCFPRNTPSPTPLVSGTWWILLVVSLIALAIAVAAGLLAYRAWRRTRHERSGESGRLLETGEGRTRFMAGSGLFISTGFVVLLIFNLLTIFIVPLCSY